MTTPRIVIDTREQNPWGFTGLQVVHAKLDAGDYSLEGFEGMVAVERKSKADAYGCVGKGRKRFVECLKRLSVMRAPAVVIEANLDDMAIQPSYTKILPAQAIGSYISWSEEYRIPVFFAPNREYAERVALKWLAAFYRHRTT